MVNRRLLRWGVFLLALGSVVLLGAAGRLDAEVVRQALGLWPLAVIGVGAAILLRRTRLGLVSGAVAAAVPGLLIGGAIAAVPDLAVHCRTGPPATYDTRSGTLAGRTTVDVSVTCGELAISTGPGANWEARFGRGNRPDPRFETANGLLRITTAPLSAFGGPSQSGGTLELRLPTEPELDLAARVDAGRARLDLRGASLSRASVAVDAGHADIDLTDATLERLVVAISAGGGELRLPVADFSGEIEVNAGELHLCVPEELGLRVRSDVTFGSFDAPGFRATRAGAAWETGDYALARHHADMTVTVNAGSVKINPTGGCQ